MKKYNFQAKKLIIFQYYKLYNNILVTFYTKFNKIFSTKQNLCKQKSLLEKQYKEIYKIYISTL